jgi:hypothetical protein
MSERSQERGLPRDAAVAAQKTSQGSTAPDGGGSPLQRDANQRKVRSIVTVRGRAPRGYFPSLKAQELAQFESLVEEDALRVLEVSSYVLSYQTQPVVLVLTDDQGAFNYTPDVVVRTAQAQAHYLEVKPDSFVNSEQKVHRLQRILLGMRRAGHRWSLLLESDLRNDGLQKELKELLRLRPAHGRLPSEADTAQWDPWHATAADVQTAGRWVAAQAACDQLLKRVVGRDAGNSLLVAQA